MSAAEKILILDRGDAEVAIPRSWTVKPDPAGFVKIEDSSENCLLELSCMRLPPLSADAPTAAGRLGAVLPEKAEITAEDRGDLRLAWADYAYEADVAVWSLAEGDFEFIDALGAKRSGHRKLLPVATVKAGRIYR